MSNYAVRITRSYAELGRGINGVALLCDKALVYEHVGSATEKVHVHMMLVGVRCDKKTVQKCFSYMAFKGNKDWSWKTKDAKYGPVEDSVKYITYMTKGKLDPVYNKGYSQEQVEEAKASWVDMKKKSAAVVDYEKFKVLIPADTPKEKQVVIVGTKVTEQYVGFSTVRSMAFKYVMEKFGVASPAAKCLMSTLYRTYCFEKGIELDPKFDTW